MIIVIYHFREWLQCYGKKEKIVDANGRTFWYDNNPKTDP